MRTILNFILLFFIAIISITSVAQTTGDSIPDSKKDTTIIRLSKNTIYIIKNEHKQTQINDTIKNYKTNKFHTALTINDLTLGINGLINNNIELRDISENLQQQYGKSINFKLKFFTFSYKKIRDGQIKIAPNLKLGFASLELEYANYRFNSNYKLQTNTNHLTLKENTENDYYKNKLTVSYINLPVTFNYKVKRTPFVFTAGIDCGVRLRSHTKVVYYSGNSKNKRKEHDDFNLNNFKYGVTAGISLKNHFGIFGNVSLSTLFKSNQNIDLYPFSVGIRLF